MLNSPGQIKNTVGTLVIGANLAYLPGCATKNELTHAKISGLGEETSSSCISYLEESSSILGAQLSLSLGIDINDCILKEFETIPDVANLLQGLYKGNPSMLEKDLQDNFHALYYFLSSKYNFQRIIDFHDNTPSLSFSIDEGFLWEVVKNTKGFPLEEFSGFLNDHSDVFQLENVERRGWFFTSLIALLHRVSPKSFTESHETQKEKQSIDINVLTIFFQNSKSWKIIDKNDPFYWVKLSDARAFPGSNAIYRTRIGILLGDPHPFENLPDTRISQKIMEYLYTKVSLYDENTLSIERGYGGKDEIGEIIKYFQNAPRNEVIERITLLESTGISSILYVGVADLMQFVMNSELFAFYISNISEIDNPYTRANYTSGFPVNGDVEDFQKFHKSFLEGLHNPPTSDRKIKERQLKGLRGFEAITPVNSIEKEICEHPLVNNCHNVLFIFKELDPEKKISAQTHFWKLLNIAQNDTNLRNDLYGGFNGSFDSRLSEIYGKEYNVQRMEDLITLLEKGGNLSIDSFRKFLVPPSNMNFGIDENGNPNIIEGEEILDHENENLYTSGLSKGQKEDYLHLLSLVDLSDWGNSSSFSLLNSNVDNRNILEKDFVDILEQISKIIGRRVKFSELDLAWLFYKNPEEFSKFLSFDHDSHLDKIWLILSSKRSSHRIVQGGSAYSEENEIDILSGYRISMIMNMLENEEVQLEVLKLLEADRNDRSTEHGGIVNNISPYFHNREARVKMGDGSFASPFDLSKYSNSIANYHFHALPFTNLPMIYFSGPSLPDRQFSNRTKKIGIVITDLGNSMFNVDYVDASFGVTDLGIYAPLINK